jgi:hypothetical protein
MAALDFLFHLIKHLRDQVRSRGISSSYEHFFFVSFSFLVCSRSTIRLCSPMDKALELQCSWQLTGSMPSPVEPMLAHEMFRSKKF